MNVIYVNANDEIIGAGSITNAVDNGIIVRISRVFLRNSKGDLLLQKRSDTAASQGKWDQTAGGHVDENEDYESAAVRELAEEMGITNIKLQEVATFYSEETDETKVKKRFNKIFSGKYDGAVKIDNDEVTDYKWITLDELTQQMQQAPDNFPDGFIKAFKIYQAACSR